MSSWVATLWLGWPLLVGIGICAALYARLREEWRAHALSEPVVVSRAMLFFAEGDVLRALVVLEGEQHPLCYLLSAFWKQIPTPRQWEGIALIAEYQRKAPQITLPIRREVWGFGQLLAATILLQIGWIALQRPQLLQRSWQEAWVLDPGAGVLWMTLALLVWGVVVWRSLRGQLGRLLLLGDQVVYQSIEALDHGRQRPLVVRLEESEGQPAGNRPPPPPGNYVSQVYKSN